MDKLLSRLYNIITVKFLMIWPKQCVSTALLQRDHTIGQHLKEILLQFVLKPNTALRPNSEITYGGQLWPDLKFTKVLKIQIPDISRFYLTKVYLFLEFQTKSKKPRRFWSCSRQNQSEQQNQVLKIRHQVYVIFKGDFVKSARLMTKGEGVKYLKKSLSLFETIF